MSSRSTFIEGLLTGTYLAEDIDDEVDRWSDSTDPRSLHEYLGMSWDEYSLWAERPSSLRFIVAARQRNTSALRMAQDEARQVSDYARRRPLAAVARAAEDAAAVDVLKWLRDTGRI